MTKTRSGRVILEGTVTKATAAVMSSGMTGLATIPSAGTSSQGRHSKEVWSKRKGSKRPNKKPLAQPKTKLANMAVYWN